MAPAPRRPAAVTAEGLPFLMTIRAATPEDVDAIAGVHVRTWRHAYQGLLPQSLLDGLDPERRASDWRRALAASSPACVQVATDEGGVVVGFVATGPDREDDRRGEVYAVHVDQSAQGRGYGRVLLSAAEADLLGRGFDEAILWVLDGNEPAMRFYEASGWLFDGGHHRKELGGFDALEWRMHRLLGTSPSAPDSEGASR